MTLFEARRNILRGAACTVAAMLAPKPSLAQAGLQLTQLSNDLAVVSGDGANITVAAGADDLLLVDVGLAERAAELSQLLESQWPGKPVRTVINTNWRAEHGGANEHFIAAGARVLAHENTRLWMAADFYVEWQRFHHARRPVSGLPTSTFFVDGQVKYGVRTAEYGWLPRAHTDGDVYVYFSDSNVLAVSDLLAVDSYPAIDYVTGGWIGGMADATRALLALSNDTTRVVPANGSVQSRQALVEQLALCTQVLQKLAASYRTGGSFDDFVRSEPTAGFDATRGDPKIFLELAYEGAYPYVRELGGII